MNEAHRHRWEDISERQGLYTVQRCNGLGGCGTIRRIDKALFPGREGRADAPRDHQWEVMFQGEEPQG
jgi:hypothetical protein